MRKRSKYRPNKNLVNPLAYVLENMKPVTVHSDLIMETKLRNRLAVQCLREGNATMSDMQDLIEMHNFVDRLMGVGFGKDYLEVLQKGQEAILSVAKRTPRTGAFKANDEELLAITELIDLNDAQLEVITINDVRKAELYAAKHSTSVPIELMPEPISAT